MNVEMIADEPEMLDAVVSDRTADEDADVVPVATLFAIVSGFTIFALSHNSVLPALIAAAIGAGVGAILGMDEKGGKRRKVSGAVRRTHLTL